MNKLLLFLALITFGIAANAENKAPIVKGIVVDVKGSPLASATVYVNGTSIGASTDDEGVFIFPRIKPGTYNVTVSYVGYVSETKKIEIYHGKPVEIQFQLKEDTNTLSEIEVFGVREKQPEKLDAITRMPLRPSEQIQSISIISNKLIEEQGNMNITDAVRNVVGVTQFASFGGVQESLMARGYRGIPTLKNGVRVQSDFRGGGFITDMQGIESIQVLKGSAAITQGIGNDLGSAGGVINLATKTPKFINAGDIGIRTGSWGQFRPTFDVQGILDKQRTVAFRINGAYERSDSYRKYVSKDRIYVNPSLAWRPNNKTTITLEMDYLHDTRTPDRGTVNLAPDSIDALYKMPNNKFLGFKTDRNISNNLTYALRYDRKLNDLFNVRIAYFGSALNTDNTGASVSKLKNADKTKQYNLRSRSLGRSLRDDKNSALQIDLIGHDVFTGSIKHTFQVGFDYRATSLTTTTYNSVTTDTIDILKAITNDLPAKFTALTAQSPVESNDYSYGMMAQDVMTFNKYLKATVGLRYSYGNSTNNTATGVTSGDAWNPVAGIIITPIKQINLFGSYTSTTSLRSAANKMIDGSLIGTSRSDQFETGIKSDWLNNRLRFNLTYFHILNKNLAYNVYDANFQATSYYDKAGNLRRQGIETELTGRILPNLEVILGYAYLKAEYEDSPAYQEGSAPLNTPAHTVNSWAYYTVDNGFLKGLSLGVGTYYVGKRPINDYTYKAAVHDTQPDVKPFDMKAYTTVNAQLAYNTGRFRVQTFFNNIFNELGYTSYYRGGYINQIDPFNLSAAISYRF